MKIIYTKYGIANFYEDHIELNHHLKENPKLEELVLKHELSHKKEFDLKHEFDFKLGLKLIFFIVKHPSTWVDFLPLQVKKEKIVFNLNLFLLYLMMISGIFVLFKIAIFIYKNF